MKKNGFYARVGHFLHKTYFLTCFSEVGRRKPDLFFEHQPEVICGEMMWKECQDGNCGDDQVWLLQKL